MVFFDWNEKQFGDNTQFDVQCRDCDEWHSFTCKTSDVESWRSIDGLAIQDAMPYLQPCERELLLSGLCDDCWKKKFED